MTFHVNVLEATRGYLPGNWDILWSLSVEGMFYLFSPLLCAVLGRSKWLGCAPLSLCCIGTAWPHSLEPL
jgi:peptidoglycan/LPS O-acetylase OafA/YrhL